MKKLLSAAVAALLICVCAACSPAEDPSSVPSSEDTTTAAAESTTAPTARPTARPTAEPTTKPTAAPTFPKTEIYTPVIAEINAAGPLYFQKSPSMKVDGTDNLYWYAMPYYNYDVMEPIGWSGMWAVRQNDKWGVIDVEGKIIVPAEFEYCYDCRSCGICLFYTPPEHGFIACRFNYDGELMTNSTDHGHGTDSAWWDITVNKSVFTSENGYQYYTFEHATIVSAIHVTGPDPYDLKSIENAKFGICKNDKLTVPLEYDYIKENFSRPTRSYTQYEINDDGSLTSTYREHTFDPPQTLYAAKKDGKAGYIDMNNNILIPFIFEETTNFIHSVAAVKLDGKWGFVVLEKE